MKKLYIPYIFIEGLCRFNRKYNSQIYRLKSSLVILYEIMARINNSNRFQPGLILILGGFKIRLQQIKGDNKDDCNESRR